MEKIEAKPQVLSKSETQEIVTPYAFEIDQRMLGLSLAGPTRRFIAMTIDIALIFLAAKLSAVIISFVAAMAFYKSTNEKYLPSMSQFTRRALKILAACILFVSALSLLDLFIDNFSDEESVINIEKNERLTKQEIVDVSAYLKNTEDDNTCDLTCQDSALALLLQQVPKLAEELSEIPSNKVTRLVLKGFVFANENQAEKIPEETEGQTIISYSNHKKLPEILKELNKPSHSILAWSQGLLADLGLGFGWAAIYFTVLSVLWKGQTLGKKLCGIRVLGLDGSYLNLWESFGRYGGYGAGFATGLLGFLQIYWDPNRQAIQDKISATVVVKGNRPC